jgi:hypothetical protein
MLLGVSGRDSVRESVAGDPAEADLSRREGERDRDVDGAEVGDSELMKTNSAVTVPVTPSTGPYFMGYPRTL